MSFKECHLRETAISVEPAAQSAQGSGIAQAYGPGATASVTIGLTPEELQGALRAAGAE